MGSLEGQVSAVARELQGTLESLKDKRVKNRKDGLQRLDAVLAKEVNLVILDCLTFGVGLDNERDAYACEYASWKAILDCLTVCVEESVVRALGKGQTPDSMYSRVVRTVVNKAISRRGPAGVNVLEPCAASLMEHLSLIMEKTYPFRQEVQVYNDYATTLKFLMDNGEYMVFMGPDVFERTIMALASLILDGIEISKRNNASSSFMVKDLTMLRAILLHLEYDLSHDVMNSVFMILAKFGENKNLREWTARICNEVVGLCVQVMIYSRGDNRNDLSDIVEQYHHSCMLLLREGNPEGREAALHFFRVAFKLELIRFQHIEELLDWYHEFDLVGAWQKSPECQEYAFNYIQSCLANLLGEIEIYVYNSKNDISIRDSDCPIEQTGRTKSRRRQVNLISDTLENPAALCPITCIFMQHCGQLIDEKMFQSICSNLKEALENMLQHSFVGEQVKPEVVWMLRFLHTVIATASKRRALCVYPLLGDIVSLLIQQYKILSSYQVTRDIIKMIIIVALPEMHDFIQLPSMDAFKQELLSESPNSCSVVLFTLLIRYKKFLAYSHTDIMLSCNWILESIALNVPSDFASDAISTIVFGGNAANSIRVQKALDSLESDISWVRRGVLDDVIGSLSPVSKWSLKEYLDDSAGNTVACQIAAPLDINIGTNQFIKDKLRATLDSYESFNVEQYFHLVALGIDVLCNATNDHRESDMWSSNSTYFDSLVASIEKCIQRIRDQTLACANMSRESVESMMEFSDAVSKLGDEKFSDYHASLRTILEIFPEIDEVFNISMRLGGISNAAVEQEEMNHSQTMSRAPLRMVISRSITPTEKLTPMLQWFLRVYEKLSIFHPLSSLKKIYSCIGRFYQTKYFLPLVVRNQLASAECQCICQLLRKNEVPEDLQYIQFLHLEKGIYSYDCMLLFRSGVFEIILFRAFALIKQAQSLENEEDANVCIRIISDQAIQLISDSIEQEISVSQRICAANLAINLLDIDSSLLGMKSFELLVDWLATLVLDRYAARVEASKIFPRLLEFFSEPKVLFQKVLEMLPLQCNEDAERIIQVDSDINELLGTIVLTLGTVASKIASLELLCVSSLIQEFSDDRNDINEMIIDVLHWLGSMLGYNSAKDYLLAMSRSILVHMMRNPKKATFCMGKYFITCQKLGLDGVPEKEILLSFLVHHRSISGVQWLLRFLNEDDFHHLLLASRGEICAVHLYLTGVDEMEGFLLDVANNISKMAVLLNANLDLDSIMHDLSEDIIINIIGHGWESEEEIEQGSGIFSKDVLMIAELVNRLSSSNNQSHLRPVDAVDLLIEVQKKIFAFRHPRHKVQALKATKCSILYVEDYFSIPGVLRQVLAILKILIRFQTTCEAACEILIHVIDRVLSGEAASEDFKSLVSTIEKSIPLFLSYICDTYSNSVPQKESYALKCIRYLTCDAPDALKQCRFIVDPRIEFVSNDGDLLRYMEKKMSAISLKLCIDDFAEIVGLLSESTRLRFIKMLQQMIRLSNSATSRPESEDIERFITETSLWKIVIAAASNDCDKSLVDFAGELVAHFGPLGPQILSFKPTEYHHKLEDRYIYASIKSNAVEKLETAVFCECLLLLSEYLVGDDALVASEAFAILQEILSTSAGCNALNRLDSSSQLHLSIFIHSKVVDLVEESEKLPEKPSAQIWQLDGSDYDVWITRIGHDILHKSSDHLLSQCANLAKLRANFAEVLLPLAFVRMSEEDTIENQGPGIGTFLGSLIEEYVLPFFGQYPKGANVVLKTLHVMRQIYNHAEEQSFSNGSQKLQGPGLAPLKWNTMYWLDVDYLMLTKACIDCRSLYSALIFAEMWKEKKETDASASEFQKYEHLMQEIYSLLPEPDGLYAMSRSNDALSQLRRFEREGDWPRAMVISDLAIQLNSANSPSVLNIPERVAVNSLRRCLSNLGSSVLLSLVGKYTRATGSNGNNAIAEGLSALGEWYPLESSNDTLVSETTDPHLATAMKHLQIGYNEGFIDSIHNVRNEVIHLLAAASRETTADLNPLIVKAQMAQNMSEAWDLKLSATDTHSRSKINIRDMVMLWKHRESIAGSGWRFSLDMPLKDLRYELLKNLGKDELEAECLLDIAVCARKSDRNGQALGALSRFRQSVAKVRGLWAKVHRPPEANWRIEEAKTLWSQNQHDAAVMTLVSCSMSAKCSAQNVVDVAYLNCVLSKWLASTQRESSSAILKTLRNNTETLAHYAGSYPSYSTKVCRIHYRLASYANQLSKEIANKKLSIEWLRSKSILEKKMQERQSLEAELQTKMKKRARNDTLTGSARQMMISINKIDAAILEDSKAIGSADENEREYELLAIKGYSLALKHGGHYDLPAMFRLIDIWLSHTSKDDEAINVCFGENASDIPSHKLIPLSYQLASRLSLTDEGVSSSFQENLNCLLLRMTKDHPFHMLPILFALKNGDKAADSGAGALVYEANKSRIDAAFLLISLLQSEDERMQRIVYEMEIATQGYIDLARTSVPKQAKEMPFPAKYRRQFCRELKSIPVLSVLLPLDLSLAYKDLPTIEMIDEKIRFPGGINKPKLVTITDSFGHTRRQLVKGGRDDLRQDAVMQQFFRICNAFLREAKSTSSRNLSIRTYFALPFSPSSGVLEWIDHTDSLSKFIVDGNQHYQRTAHHVHQKLVEIQKETKENESIRFKKKVFDQCVKEVGEPRMRKVFLRRFPDPGKWFEARLTYTRSVAVNSMAGHIIGLGDRHLTNILISQETAEVVHIDLGIAFEQGKLLPTPERVPFRLTRNMVDGMGATGVEGVMRRCCEETMRVLRKHKEPILTVLSVFIHDPLYNWALTYDRATKKQDEDSSTIDENFSDKIGELEGNVDANRTLLRIQHKLEGIVGGDTTARGVEGQVQYLMSEAMDPMNLCRMYRGWQAHI